MKSVHARPDGHGLDVLCIGETMVLVTPSEAESLRTAERFRLEVGGAESTVALYLAEAGRVTAWASRVGDDALGRRILDHLTRYAVDTRWVSVDPDSPTGVYFKDPGSPVRYYRRGSAATFMSSDWLNSIDPARARVLHLTGITPALSTSCASMVDHAVKRARSVGTTVSIDVNYRPGLWSVGDAGPTLLDLGRRADLLFIGRDEAETLWGCRTAADVGELVGPGPIIVVKDGAVGATELSGETSIFVPAPVAEVVEEVGAGDAFAAGYLGAWLDGAGPADRLAAGHRLAARALGGTADFVPLPS